jgi:hypothetical protein
MPINLVGKQPGPSWQGLQYFFAFELHPPSTLELDTEPNWSPRFIMDSHATNWLENCSAAISHSRHAFVVAKRLIGDLRGSLEHY